LGQKGFPKERRLARVAAFFVVLYFPGTKRRPGRPH